MEPNIKKISSIIPKGWGCEIIIANNSMYCGKILRFNAGCKTSMHFHSKKHETWYIVSGKYIVRLVDPQDASIHEYNFEPGMTLEIEQNMIHQIESLEAGDVYEVSTKDDVNDSYRVAPGSSQLKQ